EGSTAKITAADKGKPINFSFANNILEQELILKESDESGKFIRNASSFRLLKKGNSTSNVQTKMTVPIEVAAGIDGYTSSEYGFIMKDDPSIVHIFIDKYGNNLFGTIPQGIANHQYKVHVIYPGHSGSDADVSYTVRQKTGSYNSNLSVYNNN